MKYLRTERNYPETCETKIEFKATSKPKELFELIRDDEDNLIKFIINDYNSKLPEGGQFASCDDVTVEIGHQSLEFWCVYCNTEFLMFSLKIVSESEKLLEEIKR